MANPVLVEVTRGTIVESRHRGAFVVLDADGGVVAKVGDTAAPVFPRSAIKAIQALPLLESGAADAYGFGNKEIALACASHSGEDGHVALAASMLARAGRSGDALECGAHWSGEQDVFLHQARTLSHPTALHNNCSGKHAGFVCAACHQGIDPAGYVTPGHGLQEQVRAAMESVTGAAHGAENRAVDGCAIPTYAIPLDALALGFARMGTGAGLAPARAAAARRIVAACMCEPWFVAGTHRACTEIMAAGDGKVFVKTGAEGVYVALLPASGLAIALKCDDGAGRAAEAILAALLLRFAEPGAKLAGVLERLAHAPVKNRKGEVVGEVRAVGQA